MKKITIVCGPTAGGKTDYAFNLAKENDGIIINADSKQIFKDIKILSASPDEAMKNALPHYLYNFLEAENSYNVANYVNDVKKILEFTEAKYIYIVGGTGMYIDALMNGMALIPEIPQNLREEIRAQDTQMIYNELCNIDSEAAKKLNPYDKQRILRAYEVIKATGKPIGYWQKNAHQQGILENFDIHVMIPERSILYDNCNKRFLSMIDFGGIEEVRKLQNMKFSEQILGAIGVKQIIEYLRAKCSFDAMVSDSQAKTRQYAKRQVTWFKRYSLLQ